MKQSIFLLILLCGCSAPKLNRTYRTPPPASALLRTRLEPTAPSFEIQDLTAPELPKATRIWFSTNSNPVLVSFEWANWPTNIAAVFEWTTNMSTWEQVGSDGCSGSPPGPFTRNASTVARDGFTAVRMRLISQ